MPASPRLATRAFDAVLADNRALGDHRAGYNGVAQLIERTTGRALFKAGTAGLNYEITHLAGQPPYVGNAISPFEPRAEPLQFGRIGGDEVELLQPATPHSGIAARITFRVDEPCYLHQHIELTFQRRFAPANQPNTFHALFASYMAAPPDLHLYTWRPSGAGSALASNCATPAPNDAEALAGWTGLLKRDHGPADWELRPLPHDELSPAEHRAAMQALNPSIFPYGPVPPTDALTLGHEPLPGSLPFYYGLIHDMLFLMMFRQPERFRFAYSPNGGDKSGPWNPAWDYVLFHPDAPLETTCAWDLCLCVKPFVSRADVLAEVCRYRADGK